MSEEKKSKERSKKLLVFTEQEFIDRIYAMNLILARGVINETQRHIYSNQKKVLEAFRSVGQDFDQIVQQYGTSEKYFNQITG